jgi:hypothetical protein
LARVLDQRRVYEALVARVEGCIDEVHVGSTFTTVDPMVERFHTTDIGDASERLRKDRKARETDGECNRLKQAVPHLHRYLEIVI